MIVSYKPSTFLFEFCFLRKRCFFFVLFFDLVFWQETQYFNDIALTKGREVSSASTTKETLGHHRGGKYQYRGINCLSLLHPIAQFLHFRLFALTFCCHLSSHLRHGLYKPASTKVWYIQRNALNWIGGSTNQYVHEGIFF